MKTLDEMTTSSEVDEAYVNAIRNMSFAEIKSFMHDARAHVSDSPLVAHAKACLRKYLYLEKGIPLDLSPPVHN